MPVPLNFRVDVTSVKKGNSFFMTQLQFVLKNLHLIHLSYRIIEIILYII